MKEIFPSTLREDDVIMLAGYGQVRAVDDAHAENNGWVFVTLETESGASWLATFYPGETVWWMGRISLPDAEYDDLEAPL